MVKKDKFTLTVQVELKDLAEFSVATDVLGQRTNSAFVYQFMMQKVREAKSEISESEFERLVESKRQEILKRSKRKSLERKQKNEDTSITLEEAQADDAKKNDKRKRK